MQSVAWSKVNKCARLVHFDAFPVSAPVGVGMPTSLSVYSGYVVQVEWDEPESTSGLLTKTIVTAYNVNSMAVPPTTVEVFGSVNKKGYCVFINSDL